MSLNRRQLGQYELQQRIISDAMGEVWTAFDTRMRRYVFIHIIALNTQAARDTLPQFTREAQSVISLHHPNILQVLEVHAPQAGVTPPDETYFVLEYIEGQTLADYIHATVHAGHFPPPAVLVRLFMPIASALDYAHQQGIVHGSLKPSSILLNRHNIAHFSEGEPELIGFGTNGLPRPSTLPLNDAFYMAPEVAGGQRPNERSDLYSLGVILYELCTGVLPFQGETPDEVMRQHLHATPTAPALINPRILPALTAVIMRSLSKDPEARFPTASSMVVAIARAFNIPTQDAISQSGNWAGTGPNPLAAAQSGPAVDHSQEVTYLTPQSPYYPPPAMATHTRTTPATTPAQSPATPFYGPGSAAAVAPAQHAQTPAASAAPPVIPSPPPARTRSKRWYLVLASLLIIAVVVGGVVVVFTNLRSTPAAQTPVVGHAFFVSSGILSLNSSQGIADRLQVDLQNLPAPQPGKSYYAWLLADNDSETGVVPILIGKVASGGQADLTFDGDAQHSDLLALYSRFLITEENAGTTPNNPSLDSSTWRYYAAFSQKPNPQDTVDHFSMLDHLRHLLAQDPKLKAAGLTGGLDIWLYRNTLKILEWSGSARDAIDAGDPQLARRQLARILDYLDGTQYIQTENLPPDLRPVLADPTMSTIARVALLEIDQQNQNPPGYLKHIGNHLRELTQSPGVNADQKALAVRINTATNNVTTWLEALHSDAAQLIHMTPAQLEQPRSRAIFDRLFTEANYAFVGQTDPATHQVKEGVVQIHYNIQRLATFTIAPCSSSNPCSA
ncbi:MAG TPA: protein kinase [Ktedonobacteraceae bacterium]|nr:protein kinase [Ktedonobacteraceae bacterium]